MNEHIGSRLKQYRKIKKLTQEKLAEMVDLDVRQIARLEANESIPSVTTILKFCDVFEITPNDILCINLPPKDCTLRAEIDDALTLAKPAQLKLIKKLILAVLE